MKRGGIVLAGVFADSGRLVGLRQVPDLVFSGMIVGAGIAVRPLPRDKS